MVWTVGDCWGLGTWHGMVGTGGIVGRLLGVGGIGTVGNCWELGTWQAHHGQVKFLSLKMPGRTLLHVNFSKGESVG